MRSVVVCALIVAAVSGCSSTPDRVGAGGSSVLRLDKSVDLPYRSGRLMLLPGRYVAEAASDEGVWYRAENGVLAGNSRSPDRDAGVFIARDGRRWGVWIADMDFVEMRGQPLPFGRR